MAELEVEPTIAMNRNEQLIFQHSWCGAVLVTSRPGRPGPCPSCDRPDESWWKQHLPVAGLRLVTQPTTERDAMTTTPTTEPDSEAQHPGRYWLEVAVNTEDPLSMVGAARAGILEVLTAFDERGEAEGDDTLLELQATLDKSQETLGAVLGACASSKSQLAEKVRAVVDAAYPVTDPGLEPSDGS